MQGNVDVLEALEVVHRLRLAELLQVFLLSLIEAGPLLDAPRLVELDRHLGGEAELQQARHEPSRLEEGGVGQGLVAEEAVGDLGDQVGERGQVLDVLADLHHAVQHEAGDGNVVHHLVYYVFENPAGDGNDHGRTVVDSCRRHEDCLGQPMRELLDR